MPEMTGLTVAGNNKELSIRINEGNLLTGDKVVSAVRQKIQDSKLDVNLNDEYFDSDGMLVLMIGAVKNSAYAVRNLTFDIIDIINSQRAVRA